MGNEENQTPDSLIAASEVAAQEFPAGALYVVATPIGNAADLTVRAWWVLSHVDAIAAEDTRNTRALLARYRIGVPSRGLIAAHEHNERAVAQKIVARLGNGERVALVTDAGTPAISDPGALIVRAARAAQMRVVPVPGASALTAALSIAGVIRAPIRIAGFLPSGVRERQRVLQRLVASGDAFVLLEAPHRIAATASALAALDPGRRVVIAREMTKKFETIEEVSAGALTDWAERHEPRGEYVLVIDAREKAEATPDEIDAGTERWLAALAEALPPARAAAVAAKATGLSRTILYARLGSK